MIPTITIIPTTATIIQINALLEVVAGTGAGVKPEIGIFTVALYLPSKAVKMRDSDLTELFLNNIVGVC